MLDELVTCAKCDLVILLRDIKRVNGNFKYTCPDCGFVGYLNEPFTVQSDGTLKLEKREDA